MARKLSFSGRLLSWLGLALGLALPLALSACGDTFPTIAPIATRTRAPIRPNAPTATPSPEITTGQEPASTAAVQTTSVTAVTAVETAGPSPTTGSVTTTTASATTATATTAAPASTPRPEPTFPAINVPPSLNSVMIYQEAGDLWTIVLPEGFRRRLTTDDEGNFTAFPEGFNRNPIYSLDGLTIAFASVLDVYKQPGYRQGYEVYTMRPDGSMRKRITAGPDGLYIQRLPLAWLPSGDLLVRQVDRRPAGAAPRLPALALLEPGGKLKDLPVNEPEAQAFAMSPDRAQVAFAALARPGSDPAQRKPEIYSMPAAGGARRTIASMPAAPYTSISALAWSPDGQTLAFSQITGENCSLYTIYTVNRNGGSLRTLAQGEGAPANLSFASGGKWLAYSAAPCIGASTLKIVDVAGSGPPLDLGDGRTPAFGPKVGG